MTDHVDWAVLLRYLAGDCTAEERAHVEVWTAAAPERPAYVASLREIADLSAQERHPYDSHAALRALHARLGLDVSGGSTPREAVKRGVRDTRPSRTSKSRWLRGDTHWAATTMITAILLVVAGGLVVGAPWRRSHGTPGAGDRVYAAAPGHRLSVTLADGTRLTLAPASRLHVAPGFGHGDRVVTLEGKALFAVVHDPTHPFSVRTARTVVQDVGTQFVVQDYAEDATNRVAVIEGEVDLNGTPIRAHDAGAISPDGVVRVTRNADVGADLLWMQGGLAFQSAYVSDAVHEIARTFALDITVADSTLLMKRITASFGNLAADDVLRGLTLIIGARYERDGRTVVIQRETTGADRAMPGRTAPLPSMVRAPTDDGSK